MTRKDYELIAGAFRDQLVAATQAGEGMPQVLTRAAIQATASGLADRLQEENPSFIRELFMRKCNPEGVTV